MNGNSDESRRKKQRPVSLLASLRTYEIQGGQHGRLYTFCGVIVKSVVFRMDSL